MIKKETIIQEKIINHKFCDDCGSEIEIGMACSVARCEICGKDLCNKCLGHEDHSDGDYRTVYCKNCWTIGESYRTKIEYLENEIEKLYDEWHKKCKNE
jgi:hypothetical protein